MKSCMVAMWAVGLSLAFAEKLPQMIFQNTKDAYCGVSTLLETTARSDLFCAGKCSSDALCVAYSRRGSQCVLHNRLCGSANLLPEDGARYAAAVPWVCFGSSCYVPRAPQNKVDAKADCEKLGAHVLTIETPEEYELVKKLLTSGHNWLNAEQHGSKITNNGEPVSYTNWDPTYPPADGLCATIMSSNGKWHAHGCSGVNPFLCEK